MGVVHKPNNYNVKLALLAEKVGFLQSAHWEGSTAHHHSQAMFGRVLS